MGRFPQLWSASWLLGVMVGWSHPALALQGPRPFDGRGLDEKALAVDWKATWQATYEGNLKRWEQEARRLGDQGERELFVRMRAVRLLEALIARFPNEVEKRLEAPKEIAGNYYACGLRGYGNYVLKKLIEEGPGNADFGAPALHRILYEAPWERPWETEEGPEWVEYAASRLIALHQSGYVPDGHPYVITALRALALLRRAQGRFLEASRAMEALEAHTGRDEWWLLEEAELFFAAGREREALARFQDLYGRSEENSRARDRIQEILVDTSPNPPSFASQFGHEVKWEAIRASAVAEVVPRIAELYKEDAEGRSLLPWRDVRHSSIWWLLDRHVLSQPPAALAALRAAQEKEAFPALRGGGTPEKLFAVYRGHPWAASGQRALLAYGEEALRRGHSGLALRAFQDALSHASDAAIRSQAQVGLWLAAAQGRGDPAALVRAFEGIPPDAAYPWLGKPESAKAIREALAGVPGAAKAPPEALAALERRALRMPPLSPWQQELWGDDMPRELATAVWPMLPRPQGWEGGVLAAGPELLACFGDDPARPLWRRTPTRSTGLSGRLEVTDIQQVTVPGPFQPAIADGRVYARWGLDPTRRFLTDVVAFDLRSGEVLWSTADEPGWAEFWPAGDPTVAEGRVYVLALKRGYASVVPVSPVSLVCLDAETGQLLWKRVLASQNVTLMPSQRSAYRDCQFDLAHYGNAVTVHEGAVYCQTNLGFVARCDARDGLIEWAYTYPRAQFRWNARSVVQRQGSAPLVVGDRVVLLPRDFQGVFALEPGTGKLAWDNPFAPSGEAIGVAEGLVLLADSGSMAALDAASGRARWRRSFAEDLRGRPQLVGPGIYTGTPSGLLRLDAQTGRTLETGEWGQGGPMAAFVVRGKALVGLSDDRVGSDQEPVGQLLNPKAAAAVAAQGRPPFSLSWKLRRPSPTLWVPPPEAKLDGRLFVLSRGVIECVRMTAQGGVEWQRPLAPGHQAVAWSENTLLLIYPRSVAAVEASSGRLRWHTEVPLAIRQWEEAGPYLALGSYEDNDRSKRTAVIELATGKLLWHRQFHELGPGWQNCLHAIGWDGKNLHLFATLELEAGGHFSVVCRPTDGAILAIRRFLPKGQEWPMLFDVGDGVGFYVDQSKVPYDLVLDEALTRTRYNANLRDLDLQTYKRLRGAKGRRRGKTAMQSAAQWVQVYQYQDYPLFRHAHWIMQRGNPAYELRRSREGVIRGDRLYEVDGQSVWVVDLPSGKEVAHHCIELPSGQWARILDFHEDGDQMVIVSGLVRGPYVSNVRPYRLQVDVFDKATGRHLARQVLDDAPFWKFAIQRSWYEHPRGETQVAWQGGMLFVTDAEGLSAFAPGPATDPTRERVVRIAHRTSQPISPDGSLDDWDARGAIPVEGPRGGTVHLTHDASNLYVALACPSPTARSRHGRGDYGGGHWLEVGLSANEGSHHWGIGADDRGQTVWESLGANGIPQEARAAARHDLAAQQLIWELAIPLKSIVRQEGRRHWRKLGLSLAVWEDRPEAGADRVLVWGRGLTGQSLTPEWHEAVYLHPLTVEGEEAGLTLAHELPELPEAWEFFEWSCELRAPTRTAKASLDRYQDYLKRHPNGLPALRALVSLDQTLRKNIDTDPSGEILKLATEAGVAAPIRDYYARLTKPYLSQWVWIDPKKRPRAIMVQLNSRMDDAKWPHRVFWGEDPWHDLGNLGTPSRQYAGPIPAKEGWQEFRVPLIWLDLHDKPITGISFMQAGGGRVVWDRTAVVAEGRERVFLDDELPKGKTEAQWQWVGDPKYSGARAHTDPNPGGPDSTCRRDVWDFQAPVIDHLTPPPFGAVLSQWVCIDHVNPPRMISMCLQKYGEDPFRVVWGEALRAGRLIGPLPKLGEWQELRVPLPWTPLQCAPITGLTFEQYGGRVFWDRTAIAKDGVEYIVIEDERPAGSEYGEAWKWVDQPVKSGTKAHTQAQPQEHSVHGVLYLKDPIIQHLPFDLARLASVMQQQIPKLGPTEEAWGFFQEWCRIERPSRDRRIELAKWFLKTIPDHPRGTHLLKSLLEMFKDLKEPDPVGEVEKIIEECNVPRATRYAFRRENTAGENTFIRTWRVLGPFPNPQGAGHAKPYPPETEEVRLDTEYDVIGGKARWKFHAAADNAVDLAKLFKPNEDVVAYAVCWVYSDKSRLVSLDAGSDDGIRLWLNRRLLLDKRIERRLEPRQDAVPCQLRQGWNELLVKIEQGKKDWAFCLELLDREARGLLKEVTIATTPPAEQKGSGGKLQDR